MQAYTAGHPGPTRAVSERRAGAGAGLQRVQAGVPVDAARQRHDRREHGKQRDGADHSYLAKHLNLTLLAPDIVAAILEDALPDGVRLSALMISPPVLWEDQREALGTTPAPPRAKRVRL